MKGIIRVISTIWFTAIKRDAMNTLGWNFFDSMILLTTPVQKNSKGLTAILKPYNVLQHSFRANQGFGVYRAYILPVHNGMYILDILLGSNWITRGTAWV